jgi:hypothetical protein
MVTITRTRPRGGVPQFLLWALVGAAVCVGLLSAQTIGGVVLPVALLAGAVLLWRTGMTRSVTGALSGAGFIPLYVSWLNRAGLGTVCTSSDDPAHMADMAGMTTPGEMCVNEGSPWPWLVAGLACIAAGVILFRLFRLLRRGRRIVH